MFIAGFTAIKETVWEIDRGTEEHGTRSKIAQERDCLGSNKALLIHIHPHEYSGLFMTDSLCNCQSRFLKWQKHNAEHVHAIKDVFVQNLPPWPPHVTWWNFVSIAQNNKILYCKKFNSNVSFLQCPLTLDNPLLFLPVTVIMKLLTVCCVDYPCNKDTETGCETLRNWFWKKRCFCWI